MSKRRISLLLLAAIGMGAIAILLLNLFGPDPTEFAGGPTTRLSEYRGTNPSGVPAALRQAGLVQRGQYLAEAANCHGCHTTRGGMEYAGGVGFALPFGTIYSTNITPDRESGIGAYSDREFLDAVQRGIKRGGAAMYPAMPFASYTGMTDEDVLAIKAYLLSVPAIPTTAVNNTVSFPFNTRGLLTVWAWFFNPDRRFEPHAQRTADWNRGAYIAEALAHCGECHTPRNIAFAIDNRKKFAGAVVDGWRAYNISSDREAGLGGWSDEELFAYLATGHGNGRGTAGGPMAEVVNDGLSHLAPEDVLSLITYLRSVPAAKSSDLPAALASAAPDSHRVGGADNPLGKQIYEGACASCHSWTGVSRITPYATLTGARAVNDPRAINVVQVLISGSEPPATGGAVSMPSFGAAYSDVEVAAVANYVTARFGARGSKITEKDVARLRRQDRG